MRDFPYFAQRLFNTPLMIRPEKAEIVIASLAARLNIISVEKSDGTLVALSDFDRGEEGRNVGYSVQDGIAVIPVCGTLVQRSDYLRPFSGMTGYNAISHNLSCALDDKSVRGILLDIDSPGGEVAGCFDLADAIYEARREKPIWASLNESGYSAAYAIAAACERITVPRTGGAGSIGVLCMHVDWSEAISKAGIAVTFIQFGARKSDGAPEKPLSKEATKDIQDKVDRCGDLFVNSVARYRGVKASVIRDQEAGTFMGQEAIDNRLADALLPIDQAFAELQAKISRI